MHLNLNQAALQMAYTSMMGVHLWTFGTPSPTELPP